MLEIRLAKRRSQAWVHFVTDWASLLTALVIIGLLTGSLARFWGAPWGDPPFHPPGHWPGLTNNGPKRFPQTPFQCPRSRTATLEPGGAGGDNLALNVGLTVYNSKGVRPARDPVDSDPDAQVSLGCVTTYGNRRSCPGWPAAPFPDFLTVFTCLACYPGALPRPL